MALQTPPSGTTPIDLGTDDDLLIQPNVEIVTAGASVVGTGTGHKLDIYGSIYTQSGTSISIGTATEQGAHGIHVRGSGKIFNFDSAAIVSYGGGDNLLINDGTIISLEYGVAHSSDVGGSFTLRNSGSISAVQPAVLRNTDSSFILVVNNSGLIASDNVAIRGWALDDSFVAIDRVINTGRIVGDVDLGGGNDSYNGASGRLFGELFAGAGNDTITTGFGPDFVDGGAGNDIIFGNADGDHLFGGLGNDKLNGGDAADLLYGGAGNDILIGGLGGDTMTGGGNADVFVYQSRLHSGLDFHADEIIDFSPGDKIDISALFGPAMTYRHALAFTSVGQVRIDNIPGADLIVQVNLTGSLDADFEILLRNTTLAEMSKSDFIL